MPTIRIDDEVWNELKQRAVPLEDTPNSVLRRLLKLEDVKTGSKRSRSTQQRSAKQVRGGTPRHEYREPILQGLSELGGSSQEAAILERVEKLMDHRLNDVDRAPLPGGRERDISWKIAAREERRIIAKKGLVKTDCPRGIWELTDKGQDEARRAVEKDVPS